MQSGNRKRVLSAAVAMALVSAVQSGIASATTLTWNKNTTGAPVDGAGTWNSTNTNWYNGTTDAAWVPGDTALFGVGGAGGAVSLGASETAAGLTFNTITGSYTLSNASSAILTLASTSTPIIADNYLGTTTITAPLAGTQGLIVNFAGADTLALNDTNTFTGGLTVNGGGSLNFYSDASFGAVPTTAGTNITLTGGATLNYALGSGTTTLNANRGIAVGNGSGGALSCFSGRTLTYGGVITDVPGQIGNFSTTSVGTLILTGNSTYSGTTTITTGTLKVGITNALPTTTTLTFNDTAFGAGTLDLDGNNQTVAALADTSTNTRFITNGIVGTSTLTVTNGGTFNGVIQSGASNKILGLNLSGGTLTLGGANTYTGVTNITGGTLAIASAGSVSGTPTINVGAGAIFDISAKSAFALGSAQTLTGNGNVNGSFNFAAGAINPGTVGTAGTLTFNNNLTLSGGGLSFDLSGVNTTGGGVNDLINVTGALTLNGVTPVSVAFTGTPTVGATYTVLTSGSETGTGSFVAQQHGYTLSNTTPNTLTVTYVGGPAVANQVWNSTSSNAWDVNTTPNWFNTDSSMTDTFFNGDNVTFNDSVSGVQTAVTLAATVLPGSVTVNSNSNNYNFNSSSGTVGKISGTTGLTKLGSSTLTMNTVLNDYTGVTMIGGGIVNVAGLANINTASSIGKGSATGSAADLVIDGGTLQYTGATAQTTNRLLTVGTTGATLDGSGSTTAAVVNFSGTGPIGFTGSGTHTLTLTGSGGTGNGVTTANTFAPVIGDGTGGSTSVVKTGSGWWALTGANTFTGSVNVSGGTLVYAADSNFGAVPATPTPGSIILNGGTLNQSVTTTITLNSNRGIALGSSGGTVQLFSGKILAYGGVIADAPGSSGGPLIKDSVGTLNLSGSSTYSGPTNILAGNIQLGANNALPVTTTVNLVNTTYAGGLDLNGFNQTVAGLSDTSSSGNDTITSSGTGTSILTVNGQGSFSGTIKDGINGKVGLTVTGGGTVNLGGVDTYSGPTNISNGTLSLYDNGFYGSINNSTPINVGAGSTFDISFAIHPSLTSAQTLIGNGTIAGTLNHTAGVINPGTVGTAGTLTFNNDLNLNGGAIVVDLSGSDTTTGNGINDLITVNGNLAVNQLTSITVDMTGTPAIGSSYRIINSVSETGTPSDLVVAQRGYAVDNSVSGEVNIVYTGAVTTAANLIWSSTSSNSWDVGASPNWFNTATSASDEFFTGDDVTFDDTPGVVTSINLSTVLAPGTMTVNSNTNNFSFSGAGKISGSTGLTKSGTSTLTMATTLNDYTGATVINGGILNVSGLANIGVASSIGAGSTAGSAADLVINGATLQYTGSTAQTTNRLFSIGTAGATIDDSGAGALTFSGTGAIGFNSQSGARTLSLTGNNATTSTLVPIIGDNGGATSLTKTGIGTWALSGSNTFSGPVSILSGTLTINNSDLNLGVVPAAPTAGSILINGGTFADNAAGTLTLSSNRGIALGSAGGSISPFFNKSLSYAGIIADAPGSVGSLTKDSLGTLILSGSNTYSGGTTILSGVLRLGASGVLPTTTVLTFNDQVYSNPDATLDLGGFSQTVASLADTSTKPAVITSTGVGVGVLTVSNGGTFNGSITDGGTGDQTSLTTTSGVLTLSGPGTYSGSTNLNGGTLIVSPTGTVVNSTIYVNNGATLNLAANTATGILARTSAGINVGANGTVIVSPAVSQANRQFLSVSQVGISTDSNGAFNGLVDLSNNDMDVVGGGAAALSAITAAVKQGFNGGAWNGTGGIISSTAAADSTHLTALGILLNGNTYGTGAGSIGTFDGVNPGANDVLVKYTYYGDANLDGAVDGSDYTLIDNGFTNHLSGWQNGDFNYDGVVDGSDYTLIDNAFNTQGASLGSNPAALIAGSTSQIAGGTSAVPEPATLGLLGLGAIGLLGRRRRMTNV